MAEKRFFKFAFACTSHGTTISVIKGTRGEIDAHLALAHALHEGCYTEESGVTYA